MIIQGNRKLLAEKVAELLFTIINTCIKQKGRAVIAVPGGRSVSEIFKNLRMFELPWEQIHVFLLDERLVPSDHPESNYKLILEHLGSNVPHPTYHPFNFDPNDLEQSVQKYKEELDYLGGSFDLVLASSGEDGHIASLFPNHHSVENSSSGFLLIDDAPKPPAGRVSASYELIRRSDTGILLFIGHSKTNALQNFFNIYLSDVECPAKVMTKLNHLYVLTDLEVPTP